MAALAGMRRDAASAQRWSARAEEVRSRVEALFWMEDEGFYGIALDAAARAVPRLRIQRGPPPLHWPSRPRSRGEGDEASRRRRVRLGLRHSHAGPRPGQLQSDVISQRIGVAARHGNLRRRDSRATATSRRRRTGSMNCFARRRTSACACPSSIAASRAVPASRRSRIPSRACRRRGPRVRCSWCCRRALA